MGVLADKMQNFVDAVQTATTAMDDDVVENKVYWKGTHTQTGTLPHIDTDAYNVNIAKNKEDINVIFLKKTYTLPTDIVTISNALIAEVMKKKIEIHCTDSKDDIFYNPDTDGDFYDKVILENYWDREVSLPNITLSTDDFLINSTATNHIVVSHEWLSTYPAKKDYFTLIPDTTDFICSVDGNLVPFYDALPDWTLTEELGDEVTDYKTWIINSDAVRWISKDVNVVGFAVLKGYESGDTYQKVPNAGRIYFPAGVKIIIDETKDEAEVGDFTFHNKSIVRYGDDGVTVNQQLQPLTPESLLINFNVNGMGDIIDTTNPDYDNFTVTGTVPIVKVLHAYQEAADSNRHVIVVDQPFIFDFKYSVLMLVDDGGTHTSGGDDGLTEDDIPKITQTKSEVSYITTPISWSEDCIDDNGKVYTNTFMINNATETLVHGVKMTGALVGLEDTYSMGGAWGLKVCNTYNGYNLYVMNQDIMQWINPSTKQTAFCWMSTGYGGVSAAYKTLPKHYRIYLPAKSVIVLGDVHSNITQEEKTWIFDEPKFTGARETLTPDMILKDITVNADGVDIVGTLPIIDTIKAHKLDDEALCMEVNKKSLHEDVTDYVLVIEEACVYDNAVSKIICVD